MSIEVMVRQMTAGFGQTCLIFFLTLIFSLPLGMIVYFGRVCRFKPLSWLVKIYISIMRGTPLMLQLLIWYFGPFYLWGMNIGGYKFTAIILGCSLNYAAYFAEIYRSGSESIPTGQYEAAQLLGYTRVQTFFKIVLPQVVKSFCHLSPTRSSHWSKIPLWYIPYLISRCLPLQNRLQLHRLL